MDNFEFRDAMRAQEDLQKKSFGINPSTLDDNGKIEFIRWNILALTDELHETLKEVGWKPWATSRHINRDAYVSELVDAFHFFMNLMIVVDCDAEEILERYQEKRKINAARQKQNYDGVSSKCIICKRALDDFHGCDDANCPNLHNANDE